MVLVSVLPHKRIYVQAEVVYSQYSGQWNTFQLSVNRKSQGAATNHY